MMRACSPQLLMPAQTTADANVGDERTHGVRETYAAA